MNLATFPFPQVNASLNGASAVLLAAALICIKNRKIKAHVTLVIGALICSTVFLAFYLLFHWYRVKHGIAVTQYPPGNSLRPLYYAVLISHTALAFVILPLIIATVYQAMSKRWRQHRSIATWTFPLWLYVSITGVVIYWMLSAAGAYHPSTLAPGTAGERAGVRGPVGQTITVNKKPLTPNPSPLNTGARGTRTEGAA